VQLTDAVDERPAEAIGALGRARWHRDGERPLVLVIEDNPHEREIYGKILYYNGHDVLYASDGETGYVMAREHQPDLILLDLLLPKLDGLSLCERLAADSSWTHVPIVVLSACSKTEFGPRARAAGCTLYLQKPVAPVDVLLEVEAITGKPPPSGVGRAPTERQPSA
jgi:DNA-binding response OmpR family regulator